MPEQRIGIQTGTGDYVATRDAYDTNPGERKVQRIDFSSDHLPTTFNSSPHRSAVSASDGTNVLSLSVDPIPVGDKNSLVISCEFSSSATCVIVPVFYDADDVVMFIGDELTFVPSTLRRGASGDYMSSARLIDTMGATSIRLFVKTITSGNVDIYAGVI